MHFMQVMQGLCKCAGHWPRINADDADQASAHNPPVPSVSSVQSAAASLSPLHRFIALASGYASCRKKLLGLVFGASACGAASYCVHIRFAIMHFMQLRA